MKKKWMNRISFFLALVMVLTMLPVTALAEEEPAQVQEPQSCTVAVKAADDDIGRVSGGDVFSTGENATVIAYPQNGYRFVGWYDAEDTGFTACLSDKASYTFAVTGDLSLVAKYEANVGTPASLTVTAPAFTLNGVSQTIAADAAFNIGEVIFLSFTDTDKQFLYWANGSNKPLSTKPDYQFVLSGDTDIHAVYVTADENVVRVVFRNSYAQIINDASYNKTGANTYTIPANPVKMGTIFKGWYVADASGNPITDSPVTADDLSSLVTGSASRLVVIVPDFDVNGAYFDATVSFEDESGNPLKPPYSPAPARVGEKLSVTAPKTLENKTFLRWKIGSETVGYDTTYSLLRARSGSVALTAVYGTDSGEAKSPIVNIIQTYASFSDGKYVISNTLQYYLPQGVADEIGFVYGTSSAKYGDEDTVDDNLMIGSAANPSRHSAKVSAGDVAATRGLYTFNGRLSMPTTTLYIRAYVIYRDANGVLKTAYSAPVHKNYYDLSGAVSAKEENGKQLTVSEAIVSQSQESDTDVTATATIPQGVRLSEGASTLEVVVNQDNNEETAVQSGAVPMGTVTTALGDNAEAVYYDVSVSGVHENNNAAIVVCINGALVPGLNPENVKVYHNDTVMNAENSSNLTAENTYYYDPVTGNIYLCISQFSMFTFAYVKETAVVTKAPEAISGLTYNGEAQALVTAGTATGGTMQYSTDGENYSTAIPTAANAGTYTVYYKAVGDATHNDTTPVSIPVIIAAAFTHSDNFANVGTCLYRVGNGNTVKLGSLFKAEDGTPDSANVHITVEKVEENSSVSTPPTYTANADWTQSTLKFTGEGPVRVTIREGSGEPYTLPLEVISAKNVTAYSELANANCVLLNDITMSDNGKTSLSGVTLYGNGFTFDVTKGKHGDTSNGSESSNYVVYLDNANLDNVRIVGKVYSTYGGEVKADYNYPCVLASGNCVIANSYISNCAAPVRIRNGNLYFENSTLKGGSLCNLDIRTGAHVIANGLTTINQVADNDANDNGKVIVGLGILFYYESLTGKETLTIQDGGLTQYNWVADNQTGNAVDIGKIIKKNAVEVIFDNAGSQFKQTQQGVAWINTGILALSDGIGSNNITTPDGYQWQNGIQMLGYTGNLCTQPASAPQNAQYTAKNQYIHIPKVTIDKSGDTYVDGTLTISFATGDSYNWNSNRVSAIANGKNLVVSTELHKISGANATLNSNTGAITFTDSGEYQVTYSYAVSDGYRINDNGEIENYEKIFTTTIPISVSVSAAKPVISFKDLTTTEYEIADKTYLLVTNATTTVDKIGAITETVNGQEMSIKYPIIEFTGSYGSTVYFPIFGDVVTIAGAETYNSATKTKPTGLTCYWGQYYGEITGKKESPYTGIKGGTPGSDVYKDVFNMVRGGAATVQVGTNENKAVYSQSVSDSNRTNWTFAVKYCYQEGGYTFYYYIGYKKAASSSGGGGSCVAAGTMITLADGTQKPVEELTGNEELLVWDFDTASYASAPIVFIEPEPEAPYEIIRARFSDGTEVETTYEHGFFNYSRAKFIYINDDDPEQYIGDLFVMKDGDGWRTVELTSIERETKVTTVYGLTTYHHFNYFNNDMLSIEGNITGMFNYFEVDRDTMGYDQEKKQADIEKYGLLTYEDFEGIIDEFGFMAYNGQYLAVSVGKGLITWDGIKALADYYGHFTEGRVVNTQ